MHDVLPVGIYFDFCWPVLYEYLNLSQIGLFGLIVVLDLKTVVSECVFHHCNGKLILFEYPNETARNNCDEIYEESSDVNQHIPVATQWNNIVERSYCGIASPIDEDIAQIVGTSCCYVYCVTSIGYIQIKPFG